MNVKKQRSELVFLLEEKSAKSFLDVLLPRIFPDIMFRCIPHEGKSSLRKSIPKILKAWRNPNAFFIILHDEDNHDCRILKKELQNLCKDTQHSSPLIRIACQELESWYWGDLNAVAKVFPEFRPEKFRRRARYRFSDNINNPARQLQQYIPEFRKNASAGEIAKYIKVDENTSISFKHLIEGIRRLLKEEQW